MPKPTQNGSGTFACKACKVGGEVFTPQSDDFKKSSRRATLDNGKMIIAGLRDFNDHGENVSLILKDFKGEADYNLGEEISNNFGLYFLNDLYHYTNASYTEKLTITHFDETKKIVSGTFDFKAQDSESKEVVHVSEGRFDLHYD